MATTYETTFHIGDNEALCSVALVPFFVGVVNILRQATKLPFFIDPEFVVHNFPTRGRNPSSDMGIVVSLYN